MKPILKRFFPRLLLALMMLACMGISRTGSGLHAQTGLGFAAPGFVGMPDTAYAGDSSVVLTYVKNFDTLQFNDTIQIQGYIDTGSVVIPFSFPIMPNFSLAGGDSVYIFLGIGFRDNHMNGNFRIGNNTIVIWPAAINSNFGIHDSLMATVYVIDTISGIISYERPPDEGVRCYPVPASGPMYVTSTNPLLHPKEVIVRDISGKIIFVSENPMFGIETESWANGIYFLEVTFDNKMRRIYKVVK